MNLFSPECIFHINGVGKKQIKNVWGHEIPSAEEEVPVTAENVVMWCGGHKALVFGLHFLEPTFNSKNWKRSSYYDILRILWLPESSIFQHDGDPLHSAIYVLLDFDTKLQNLGGASLPGDVELRGQHARQTGLLQISLRGAIWKILSFLFRDNLNLIWKKGSKKRSQLKVLNLYKICGQYKFQS